MSKSQLTRVYIYPKFRFFSRKKNCVFLAVDDRKGLKTLSKKGCPIKNYSVSERGELGLSSHAFISISIFLMKTDFFEGRGGLNLFKGQIMILNRIIHDPNSSQEETS